jgi:CubicO group peptidase (beta-lactamase class C family)
MSAARLRNVADLVRQWVDEGIAQTLEVLVARRGVIVLHEVAGRLTTAADAPPTPLGAIFPVASITKPLTATALMTLVEEGRVGLNRPVSQYLPEFTGEGKDAVLVRHLLTHTSGLREEDVEKYARGRSATPAARPPDPTIHPLLHQYYALRYDAPLWKPPGVEMSYADFNFELVGEIVRRVSGCALEEIGSSRIFRPLGMVDTTYCRADVPAKRRVRGPPAPPDPLGIPDPLGQAIDDAADTERISYGSGSAYSTAHDIAAFAQMFLNQGTYGATRVLSPPSVGEMTRNQIPGIGSRYLSEVFPEASWGLGWSIHGTKTGFVGGLCSPGAFEHSGAGGTFLWADPKFEIVGIYFSATVRSYLPADSLRYWHSDLFMDAVTAAVEDP